VVNLFKQGLTASTCLTRSNMLNLLQQAVCELFRGAVAHCYTALFMRVNLSDGAPPCTGQGKALAAASSHYLQLLMPALAFLSISTCLQRYLQAQVRPVKHLCGLCVQSRACYVRTQLRRFSGSVSLVVELYIEEENL
jgi:hypothetical protein